MCKKKIKPNSTQFNSHYNDTHREFACLMSNNMYRLCDDFRSFIDERQKLVISDKNFTKPGYVYIFGGINFHQCGKGCHILYVFMNMGQKVRG